MFKTMKIAFGGSVIAAAAMASTAAHADTATAEARAQILEQVTVTQAANLDFGTIVVGATGGDVSVATDGSLSNCDAALVCTGTTTAAAFGVTGTTGETVNISVPGTVTLTRSGGTETMGATLSGSAASLVLTGNSADDNFTVGGSLAVNASQVSGSYVGTFTVTVDY